MKFEDFLDSHSVPFASSKSGDDMLSLFGEGNMVSFTPGGIWVPQAPSSLYSAQMDEQNGYRETRDAIGHSRSSLGDDNFIVPQMSPPNNVSKRSRLLW
ncbi:salt tolerance protein isoform X1 [Spatholobus suberectus]|nr:salt tolerance protein isoform X1 [Spatholobus suberectus]